MPLNTVPVGASQKKVVELPAEYVDAANDSLKWLLVLLVSYVWNARFAPKYGGLGLGTRSVLKSTFMTAGLMAFSLFLYHFVVQKLFVFLPKSGQSTYYMALKRAG